MDLRRRGERAQVSDLLVAVCRDSVTSVPPVPADVVVRAARHHRIAPLAHVRLRERAPDVGEALRTDRDTAVSLHVRASVLLAEIGRLLGGIPWVVFKGPVLSEIAHPVPGLRPYGDIDVLVAPEDLREASGALLDAGWVVDDHQHELRHPGVLGEMHWVTPAGLMVDLHWTMIHTPSLRRYFDISTCGILSRRRQVRVGFGRTWTMDPVDTFVHVSLHAAVSGANTLGWLLDVDQVARQVRDWPGVVARATEWGTQAQLALVLRRAASTLGTPVPPELYRLLGASAPFLALLDAVDGIRPVARQRTDASLSRLVARGVRPGVPATLGRVARKGAQGVVDRIVPPRVHPPVRVAADAAALEVYLSAVEGSAAAKPGG